MSHRVIRAVVLVMSLVSVLALGPAGATAADPVRIHHPVTTAAAPGPCPAVMPMSKVKVGQVGTGWTVRQGRLREAFKVGILGILPNGIGPGLDMIVIKVSDTPGNDMIARAGGIWAGMSGSPVYIGGKLAGSVSYGFTGSPSRIGGMTPAEAMVGLLAYPPATSAAMATGGARQINVPTQLASRVARVGRMSVQRASSLTRLAVPLAVSGLSASSRERLQQRLSDRGLDVIVTAGNSVSRPTAATTYQTPRAGGNFAGHLSYGDVTSGGIGTTTYVCGSDALAFGHPLLFAGRVAFGANNANAIAVIRDDIFGSFKLASIGGAFGRLDQDRLAGLRATLGEAPRIIPITSDVSAPSLGRQRFGETDVTTSSLVSSLAPEHLYQNIVATLDKQGAGSALVSWTVRGRRTNGQPWSLSRTNRFASASDIAGAAADDLFQNLVLLEDNGFEQVKFGSVDMNATVGGAFRARSIVDVLIARNGGAFKHRSSLTVRPGEHLSIRVVMSRFGEPGTETRHLSITVPSDASGQATLDVTGGGGSFGVCGFGSTCGKSFDDLLSILATAPRNNDLLAQLVTFDVQFNPVVSAQDRRSLDSVVSGGIQIDVNIQ